MRVKRSDPGTTTLVSGGRGSRQSECCGNAAARKASSIRSYTTKDNVRKHCATARTTNKPEMNVQDRTLQNVKGSDLGSDEVADDNCPLRGLLWLRLRRFYAITFDDLFIELVAEPGTLRHFNPTHRIGHKGRHK